MDPRSTVDLATSLKRTVVPDRSVVAKIEGSDPALKNEAVLITAHYDHNGAEGDQIFNGADDNASGSVAVLDIAEAYVDGGTSGPASAAHDHLRDLGFRGALLRSTAGFMGLGGTAAMAAR